MKSGPVKGTTDQRKCQNKFQQTSPGGCHDGPAGGKGDFCRRLLLKKKRSFGTYNLGSTGPWEGKEQQADTQKLRWNITKGYSNRIEVMKDFG